MTNAGERRQAIGGRLSFVLVDMTGIIYHVRDMCDNALARPEGVIRPGGVVMPVE
jgi:hypothetical protein